MDHCSIKGMENNLLFFLNPMHNVDGHVVQKSEPPFPSKSFKTTFLSVIELAASRFGWFREAYSSQ
jgi:hypothetical protein